jgi:hypothetical protein
MLKTFGTKLEIDPKYWDLKHGRVQGKSTTALTTNQKLDKIRVRINKIYDDMLKDEALKYHTRIGFIEGSSSAYSYACTKGIINEICSHMYGNIKWSDEMLREEASKYNSKSDFRKCSKAYAVAQKRGLLEHICNHMKK